MLVAGFAGGRQTVTTWLRAATLQYDYRDFSHYLQTAGRRWREVGDRVLALVCGRPCDRRDCCWWIEGTAASVVRPRSATGRRWKGPPRKTEYGITI